jgi:hypothetical protein
MLLIRLQLLHEDKQCENCIGPSFILPTNVKVPSIPRSLEASFFFCSLIFLMLNYILAYNPSYLHLIKNNIQSYKEK